MGILRKREKWFFSERKAWAEDLLPEAGFEELEDFVESFEESESD